MRKYLVLILFVLAACVSVRKISILPVDSEADPDPPVVVESPVKAHLVDGSTVMFPNGVTIDDKKVTGDGFEYDLTLDKSEPVTEIDFDRIAAMESFSDDVNKGASVAATTVTTVAGGYAALGLAKLIFGSCPTTYSLEQDQPVLEAESFSYSIAPGFEMRDVDRLGLESVDQDHIVLEMRNEALETHYIDHVELVEVIHSVNEDVYPDPKGNPVTVGKLIAPRNATDRDGRNGLDASKAADDLVWSTSSDRLQRASINDMRDYLDVEFEVPDLSKKHAVILRLRNSLFNTVLLYDVMLKGQGVRALDWMGRDLEKLGPRYRLAKWYREQMGMDVSIWNGTGYRALAKIADTGPIAWNEIAIRLPRTSGNTIKLRLSFIADNWHIDQIALAETGAHRSVRKIAVSEVHGANGEVLGAVLENLNHADDDYAIARPADYMRLHFDVGAPPEDAQRTWLLAAEGYYIEWMRREWLENREIHAFEPGDEAIMTALNLWKPRRDTMREQFEATRIRVR